MKQIFKETIVLLNDFENMEALLAKGVAFSRSHEVPLQVIYVHETPFFELPDLFISKEKRGERAMDKESVKRTIEEKLLALDSEHPHAILIYESDTLNRLLALVKDRKEVLVITRYQKELIAKLIEKTPFAYCIVKEGKADYKKIALPIDLEESFEPCIESGQKLFADGKIELIHDYRFIQENFMVGEEYMGSAAASTQAELDVVDSLKEAQEKTFRGYLNKYQLDGTFIEGEEVIYEDLVKYIESNGFDLTLLYRSENELLFTPSMIMGLMGKIETDFFVCQA